MESPVYEGDPEFQESSCSSEFVLESPKSVKEFENNYIHNKDKNKHLIKIMLIFDVQRLHKILEYHIKN